jgi:PAT family beta-lactamase induction signal transducer AmpG
MTDKSGRAIAAAREPSPLVFLVLGIPGGICFGFITITFPFMASHAGLPVALTASAVAMGALAYALRVLWAPLADICLTFKRWCMLATIGIVALLIATSAIALVPANVPLLSLCLFLVGALGCAQSTPVAGLMAYNIADVRKGTASGYFMCGNMGGTAAGGALGVFLASHAGGLVSAAVLSLLCVLPLPALLLVSQEERLSSKGRILSHLRAVFSDLWVTIKNWRAVFVIALVMTPVGLGASSYIFAAIAPEWHVSADLLAVLLGVGSTLASLLGCLAAGWLCDRLDSLQVFMAAGLLVVLAGVVLALGPRSSSAFSGSTLAYMFAVGAANSAYLAMILKVIGQGAAAFKYAALNSLGNFPTAYMTAFNGWIHDRAGVTMMLLVEAGVCLALIILFEGLRRVTLRRMPA